MKTKQTKRKEKGNKMKGREKDSKRLSKQDGREPGVPSREVEV